MTINELTLLVPALVNGTILLFFFSLFYKMEIFFFFHYLLGVKISDWFVV